jgi:hypothetical protein
MIEATRNNQTVCGMIEGGSVAATEEGGMEEERSPNGMSIYCRRTRTQRDWDPRRRWRMKN